MAFMSKKIWLNGKYGSIIGNYAIVDDEDYEWLNQWKWYAEKRPYKTYYVVRGVWNKKTKKSGLIKMHRLITKPKKNLVVDHINHDGLNNCKNNLRVCSASRNCQNANKKHNFRGTSLDKKTNMWVSQIDVNTKRFFLGRFKSRMEAAKAYDKAAKKYHGEFACLNFPIKSQLKQSLTE